MVKFTVEQKQDFYVKQWNQLIRLRNNKDFVNELIKEKKLKEYPAEFPITELIGKKILYPMEDFVFVVEKEVDTKFASSDEKLEYMRAYRIKQKELDAIKQEKKRNQEKINLAVANRELFTCYKCNQQFKIPLKDRKYLLESKKNSSNQRKKLIIISNCPKCKKTMRCYGGFVNFTPET